MRLMLNFHLLDLGSILRILTNPTSLPQPGRAVEPLTDDEETGDNEATPGGDEERTFFGVPAYLTVSGQLHLEVMTGYAEFS